MGSLRAMVSLLPLLPLLLPVISRLSLVQASMDTCVDPAITWWFGKNAETPCQIYQQLVHVCDPSFQIESAISALSCAHTPCHRSSVAYSLASACSVCLGAEEPLPSYKEYSQCTGNGSGSLALQTTHEHSTMIPKWAHIPLSYGDTWSYPKVMARALADSSEPVGHVALVARATNTAASAQTDNTPAIIGGVLGGIAAITIGILAGYLWFRRVRRKEKAADALRAQAYIPGAHQFQHLGMPMVPQPQYGSPQLLPFRPSGGPPMERFTPSPSHSPSPGRPRTKGAVTPAAVNRYDHPPVEVYRSPPPPPSTNPPSSHTQSPPPSHRHQRSDVLLSPIPAPLPPPIVRYETEEDAGLAQQTDDGRIEVVRLPPSYRNEWYQG